MCGRYTLSSPVELGADLFGLAETPALQPRFNVAPTQQAPVVRVEAPGAPATLALLRWGLVPYWAEEPAFKHSFRKQRCLVVADGFYEWKKAGPQKQPYLVRRRDRLPFALAGLWARWRTPEGPPLDTFTILTTTPNDLMRPLHDRMPVILDRTAYAAWLDPALSDLESLNALRAPAPPEGWEAVPVSRAVNSPAHDAPDCIEPLADASAE